VARAVGLVALIGEIHVEVAYRVRVRVRVKS
jgi:hypothetical protein